MKLAMKDKSNELLFVGFNQDAGCFACGTDSGFRIYNSNPLKETIKKEFPGGGGIGAVEMLFRANILALVGGGVNPRYPPNKVMIWDDKQSRCIGEINLMEEVKSVKLRRDRVVVTTLKEVCVYEFADLTKLHSIPTCENPLGLVAVCVTTSHNILACPDVKRGCIHVEDYTNRKNIKIPAHESDLAALAINLDGTKVASASEKGTLVRVFSTKTGTVLHELRRGTERAVMHCICFDPTNKYVACSSDKGTIHVFSLDDPSSAPPPGQESAITDVATTATLTSAPSTFDFVKSLLPTYFSSHWSYAQFRVPEHRSICSFSAEPFSMIVLSADGSAYKIDFSKGGEATRTWFAKFVASEDEAAA